MAQMSVDAKRARKQRVDELAREVRAELESAHPFMGEPESDWAVINLEAEVATMVTIVRRALIQAFTRADGVRLSDALLEGTLGDVDPAERELVEDLLRESRLTQLARRAADYAALVRKAMAILVAHPYPIGGSNGAALELRHILDGMSTGDQDLIDDASAQFSCEAEEEPAHWYAVRGRAERDWHRANPGRQPRRAKSRR